MERPRPNLPHLKLVPNHPFTPRQAEVIKLLANGASYEKVAIELGISINTVKSHVSGTGPKGERGIIGRLQEVLPDRKKPAPRTFIIKMIPLFLRFEDEP